MSLKNPMNPCPVPICPKGCVNGECKAPDYCTCDIGWEGLNCSVCVKNPGCQHGYCEKPFECKCEPGWIGSQCERGRIYYFKSLSTVFKEKIRSFDSMKLLKWLWSFKNLN